MKKLLLVLSILFLASCATSNIATDIGSSIGKSYQRAASKGTITAEQSIKAWPYISGQLKGVFASNYKLDLSPGLTLIIDALDELALKKELTEEEKGFIIGSFVRLELMAAEIGLDKYGISIVRLILP